MLHELLHLLKFPEQNQYSLDRHPRRTPSPGPSTNYPQYDRYAPPRTSQQYREGYASAPRSENWRPERQYNPRSPSPGPYTYQGPVDEDPWARNWRPPEPQPWADRRAGQNFHENAWPRSRRNSMMAQSMLEPSDNWKQTHGLPPVDTHER